MGKVHYAPKGHNAWMEEDVAAAVRRMQLFVKYLPTFGAGIHARLTDVADLRPLSGSCLYRVRLDSYASFGGPFLTPPPSSSI